MSVYFVHIFLNEVLYLSKSDNLILIKISLSYLIHSNKDYVAVPTVLTLDNPLI